MRRVLTSLAPAAAFLIASAWGVTSPEHGRESGEGTRAVFCLPCQFASFSDDSMLYLDAYRSASLTPGGAPPVNAGEIRCGTVSHHLFARELIAGYFIMLAHSAHPRTIVLLAPNHKARGHEPIALSALPWKTPFGLVEPDTELIDTLERSTLARVDEEAFLNEHSIGALAPFIARSLPGARLVPVIFRRDADRSACRALSSVLSRKMKGALVLASLDFSHYKRSAEAQREDRASLGVLASLDADHVDRAFVDSRPALLTLLSLCPLIGATKLEIVHHTNSGIMARRPADPCTSYINAFFLSSRTP